MAKTTAESLKLFKPEDAQKKRVWLLLGGRNTGKTVLLNDLLSKTQGETDLCMAMSGTVAGAEMLRTHLPQTLVTHDGYNYERADGFLEVCRKLSERGKVRNTTLVLDDCMFDNKVMKSKTQSALHLNGRHYNTSVFNTSQYAMLIPAVIRANVDYVLALKETVRANRKRLFEHYFGVFPSFAAFERVFTECTERFGVMVLDRTQSSGKLSDLIKRYRANPSPPPFLIGKKVFFKLDVLLRKLYEEEKKKNRSAIG